MTVSWGIAHEGQKPGEIRRKILRGLLRDFVVFVVTWVKRYFIIYLPRYPRVTRGKKRDEDFARVCLEIS